MTRLTSLNPWLAAVAVALCVQFPAQAQERFTLSIPGVSDNRLFTAAAASDAAGCGGKNLSPALSWNAGPAATQSYAIVMHDPDGQKGMGVDHWVHYGIKATTRQIPAGSGTRPTFEGLGGTNSKGTTTYVGPCPPTGDSAHHYIIQIYALDLAPHALPAGLTRAQLLEKIKGHVLRNSSAVRRYHR
ncbi:YbhB/YbcL family Raf kinase inhibitor-like protein [Pseudomonas fluorescens]|uniref:YbhB/YbcL family Raf kinase inhibitor-like protein n=1 Tax=Pseudomonas fluorescens TaxID=294 RepID=A0A7Z3C0D8_PSEFL|nr:YbhB/YbcL family Raf kinase inhibitor-like protein [Pseudomonas fluorescens]QJP93201.1 YbhB/YbcL family Raf kinase inhibitor-like protein [Pseudomonas fluorescens]